MGKCSKYSATLSTGRVSSVKCLVPDLMAPAGDPFFVPPRGINLPDPPGIPVAGRPDQDVLGEVPE